MRLVLGTLFLCWFIELGRAITCPAGQFDNSGTCADCPITCATCSSATTCLTCKDTDAYVDAGKCIFCAEGFRSGGACVACDASCTSKICTSAAADTCFNCPTATPKFDFTSMKCLAACPAGSGEGTVKHTKIHATADFVYCRTPELHIDVTSMKRFQLGTAAYPYRYLQQVGIEFNHAQTLYKDMDVSIKLKAGTDNIMVPSKFVKFYDMNLTISPTLTPGTATRAGISTKDSNVIDQTNDESSLILYNKEFGVAQITDYTSTNVLYAQRSSLKLINLDIVHAVTLVYSPLITTSTTGGKSFIVDGISYTGSKRFLTNLYPGDFIILNSVFSIEGNLFFLQIQYTLDCHLKASPSVIIQNNTFTGKIAVGGMFLLSQLYGSLVMKDLKFINSGVVDQNFIEVNALYPICTGERKLHTNFENLAFESIDNRSISILFNIQKELGVNTQDILIAYKNINIKDSKLQRHFMETKNFYPSAIPFHNFTITNVTVEAGETAFIQVNTQTSADFKDFVITGSEFKATVIKAIATPSTITNLQYLQSKLTDSQSGKDNYALHFTGKKPLSITNFRLEDLTQNTQGFLHQSVSTLTIKDVTMKNLNLIGESLNIFEVKDNFQSLTLENFTCTSPAITSRVPSSNNNYLIDVTPLQAAPVIIKDVVYQCKNLLLIRCGLEESSMIQQTANFTFDFTNLQISGVQMLEGEKLILMRDIARDNIALYNFHTFSITNIEMADDAALIRVSGMSDLTVTDVTMSGCTGAGIGLELSTIAFYSDNPQKVTFTNLKIMDMQLRTAVISNGNLEIIVTNSLFHKIVSTGDGAVLSVEQKSLSRILRFRQCNFTENQGLNAAVFKVKNYNLLDVQLCLISKNKVTNKGAVAVFQNEASFLFKDLTIEHNHAAKQVALIEVFNSAQEYSIIEKCILKNNTALLSENTGNIEFIDGKLKITNVTLDKQEFLVSANQNSMIEMTNIILINTATLKEKLMYSLSSTLIINNVGPIAYNTIADKGALFHFTFSTITFNHTVITSLKCPFLLVDSSTMMLYNNTISNVDVTSSLIETEGVVITCLSSTLTIKNFVTTNMKSKQVPFLQSSICNYNFDNVTFDNFNYQLSQSSLGVLNVVNSEFKNAVILNGLLVNGGAFSVEENPAVIKMCKFTNIKGARNGGAIYIKNSLTKQVNISIEENTFTGNQANQSGGAIFIENSVNNLTKNVFTDNMADMNGGALKLDCSDELSSCTNCDDRCVFRLNDNTFNTNKATKEGGAFSYNFMEPLNYLNNTFNNNMAKYGVRFSAYPFVLTVDLDNGKNPNTEVYVSGHNIPVPIKTVLLDRYNQVIKTMENQPVSIIVGSNDTSQTTISGDTRSVFAEGIGMFKGFEIIGTPGMSSDLIFKTSVIDAALIRKAIGTTLPLPHVDGTPLTFALRKCIAGEQMIEKKCKKCDVESYSLLLNATECKRPCPSGAKCEGGNRMIINSGFWRSSIQSDQIYECMYDKSCLGGFESNCKSGYKGRLCQQCTKEDGNLWARANVNECTHCNAIGWNITKAFLILFACIIMIIAMTWKNMTGSHDASDFIILLRIMTTYFQISSIASSFDLNWPPFVLGFLQSLKYVGDTSERVWSFECLTTRWFGKNSNDYFIKVYAVELSPFFLAILCIPIILIAAVVLKRVRAVLKTALIVCCVVILYLMYPTMANMSFSMFTCVDLGSSRYLTRDLSVECYGSDHYSKLFIVGIPSLLGWVIGIPLLFFGLLFKFRHDLDNKKYIIFYGFFYKGLKQKVYYWEIIETFIKISLVFSNIFLRASLIFKSAVAMFFLVLKIDLLRKLQPYRKNVMNDLILKGSYASTITLFGGMFFVESNQSQLHVFMFILILVFNLWFFLSWGWQLIKALFPKRVEWLIGKFKDKVPHSETLFSKVENNDKSIIGELDDSKKPGKDKGDEDVTVAGAVANPDAAVDQSDFSGSGNLLANNGSSGSGIEKEMGKDGARTAKAPTQKKKKKKKTKKKIKKKKGGKKGDEDRHTPVENYDLDEDNDPDITKDLDESHLPALQNIQGIHEGDDWGDDKSEKPKSKNKGKKPKDHDINQDEQEKTEKHEEDDEPLEGEDDLATGQVNLKNLIGKKKSAREAEDDAEFE